LVLIVSINVLLLSLSLSPFLPLSLPLASISLLSI
jgi:hypothetical protein